MIDKIVYLDNNSTTPIEPRVLEEMMPFLTDYFANANSTHILGVVAHDAVKLARKQVARLINSEPHEIIFTSGATEAINIGIKGIAESRLHKGNHIVTSLTEHSAVLDTCKYLEDKGFDVTYLPSEPDGKISLTELAKAVSDKTILVCIMFANNETGVIQPISDIAKIAHSKGAIFMCDATQAIGKIAVDVKQCAIDILCLSGHKMYAPKGVGALYIRQQGSPIKLPAFLHGGGHEKGVRSGTLNVPAIVALGAASNIVINEMPTYKKNITELRDYFEVELLKIKGASINGSRIDRVCNTLNIRFQDVDSDAAIMALSDQSLNRPVIAVSNGSACTSTKIEPSHVLTAMGLDEEAAFSSIRISLSKFTTKNDVDIAILAIRDAVDHLRSMN